METSYTLYTWKELLSLAVWLFCIFWVLQILMYLFERLAPKNLTTKKIVSFAQKSFLIYKPTAAILLLLGFISHRQYQYRVESPLFSGDLLGIHKSPMPGYNTPVLGDSCLYLCRYFPKIPRLRLRG